jgi:short subunit dehydrogenase-like uncharacterized protein
MGHVIALSLGLVTLLNCRQQSWCDSMKLNTGWMIYGANGYTGRLIAEEAVRRGGKPILAGRRREAIEGLASSLGCEARVFPLTTPEEIVRHLADCPLLLNTAGPFSATAAAMMEACLTAGAHYLDITGEIDCIEAAAARHKQAVERGICLIPAVGFDVVPTDCLAAMLARHLPDATHLQLAFRGLQTISHGTAQTVLENLPRGGRARIDGRIVRVPLAWKVQQLAFREGRQWAMTIPWGDVASAYHSTGIPNIEVYMGVTRRQIKLLRVFRWLAPLFRLGPIQGMLRWGVKRQVNGPSADERDQQRASIWGRVQNAEGQSVEATLQTPNGYTLTVLTALAAVERTLQTPPPPGFHTPSGAFGEDFVLKVPGVEMGATIPA